MVQAESEGPEPSRRAPRRASRRLLLVQLPHRKDKWPGEFVRKGPIEGKIIVRIFDKKGSTKVVSEDEAVEVDREELEDLAGNGRNQELQNAYKKALSFL